MYRPHSISFTLLLSFALSSGCADDDPLPLDEGTTAQTTEAGDESGGDTEASVGDTTTGDGGSETGAVDIEALYDCEDPDFAIIPMFGPGFDPRTGEFVGPAQDTYLAHTTQILVHPDAVEEFDALSGAIVAQLLETPGLIGVGFASEPNCGFMRTMGIWEDQASMYGFVASGAHAQAMAQTTAVSITGRTTQWEVTSDEMPLSWEMALGRIEDVEPSPVYD